jgi:hypothetical protein
MRPMLLSLQVRVRRSCALIQFNTHRLVMPLWHMISCRDVCILTGVGVSTELCQLNGYAGRFNTVAEFF